MCGLSLCVFCVYPSLGEVRCKFVFLTYVYVLSKYVYVARVCVCMGSKYLCMIKVCVWHKYVCGLGVCLIQLCVYGIIVCVWSKCVYGSFVWWPTYVGGQGCVSDKWRIPCLVFFLVFTIKLLSVLLLLLLIS